MHDMQLWRSLLTYTWTMASKDVESPPSPKRSRLSGATTYGTKFNSEWTAQFPFICKGHQDSVYSFYCQVCQKGVVAIRVLQMLEDMHAKSGSHTSNASIVRTNLCKSCDLRAAQRVPISKFSWGGLSQDPPR